MSEQNFSESEMIFELIEDNPSVIDAYKKNFNNPDDVLFVKEFLDSTPDEGFDISGILKMAAMKLAPEAAGRINEKPEAEIAQIVGQKLIEKGTPNIAKIIEDSHIDQNEIIEVLAQEGHKIRQELDPHQLVEAEARIINAFPEFDEVTIEGLAAAELQIDALTKEAIQQIKDIQQSFPFNEKAEPAPQSEEESSPVPTISPEIQMDEPIKSTEPFNPAKMA